MKSKRLLALLLVLVLSLLPVASVQAKAGKKDPNCLTSKMIQLKTDMQKVWIDHTIWTRSYIVSAISNRADQQDVLDRLLQNQQDIGNVIKPYYSFLKSFKIEVA